jgi:hypothetical protein
MPTRATNKQTHQNKCFFFWMSQHSTPPSKQRRQQRVRIALHRDTMRSLVLSLSFLWVSCMVSSIDGFSTTPPPFSGSNPSTRRPARHHNTVHHRRSTTSSNPLFSSAPSDSASDEPDFSAFGYGSSAAAGSSAAGVLEEETAAAAERLVNQVLQSLPSDLFAEPVSSGTQATINEILYTLEALNPTKSPALSPLVNGVWELRYSGGYTDEVSKEAS